MRSVHAGHGQPVLRGDQFRPVHVVHMHDQASDLAPARTSSATYPGSVRHISAVRAQLRSLLRGYPDAEDVILCTSELAANAAVHSYSRRPGGEFTVRAEVRPGRYTLIEVEDNGGPWTAIAPVQGHGLDIVRALVSTWGIDRADSGCVVWARFDWPRKAASSQDDGRH